MRIYHLTYASVGRHPIFLNDERRAAGLHAIARGGHGSIVLFALVDDHVHIVVWCEEGAIALLSRSLLAALRAVSDAEVQPAHRRAVEDRSHLTTLVRYVLVQPEHHGISGHPALTTGSCFPDLIGARVIPGLALRLSQVLPRFRTIQAYPHVGLDLSVVEPATREDVRRAGAARVAAAAAAASATSMTGNTPVEVAARAAAVHLARESGTSTADVAAALGITDRAVCRLLKKPTPTGLITAVRLRLALEDRVMTAALSRR